MLYLDTNTRKPLITTTEKQLLERHTSSILDKVMFRQPIYLLFLDYYMQFIYFILLNLSDQGFTMLMDAKRVDDLKRLYSLFTRVNALELIRQALGSYIRGTGQGIVMDEEKDKDLVPCLLDLKASLDTILEESFSRNEAFSNTIKDSFEHLINLRQVSALLFLA